MKDLLKNIAEMGGVLTYVGIMIVAAAFECYSIIPLAIMGIICSMYSFHINHRR